MSAPYETSLQFTEELDAVVDHLQKAKAILQSARFQEWIKSTSQNYNEAQPLPRRSHMISNLVDIAHENANRFAIDVLSLDEN